MSNHVTQLFSGVLAFRKKSTLKKNMWLHKALCPGLHLLLVAFILFYFKYQGHAGPVSVSQDSQAQTCLVAFMFAVLSAWVVLFPALSLTVSCLWAIRIRGQILPQRGLLRPSCVRWQISAPLSSIYFLSDHPFSLTTACLFIFTHLLCIGNVADTSTMGKWKVEVAWLCPTLCDPMEYTVCGILQARILEGVAVPFSSGSSRPRNQTGVSCIAGGFFTSWVTILWISFAVNLQQNVFWALS